MHTPVAPPARWRRLSFDPLLIGLRKRPRGVIGAFEIVLSLVVLIVPATSILLFVLAWKLGTEFLFVTSDASGAPLEVIERASYSAWW
jgi:hypothetical protein